MVIMDYSLINKDWSLIIKDWSLMIRVWSLMIRDRSVMIRDWSLVWYQGLVSDDQGRVSVELIHGDHELFSDK